jgi:hypothetical protein
MPLLHIKEKRIMKKFWRVTPQSEPERLLLGRVELKRDSYFMSRLKLGHGVVMADWNDGTRTGTTRALGVVLSVDAPSGTAMVEWRKGNVEFHPSPQGGVGNWRKSQGWFVFARNVADRYGLPRHFQRAFPDLDTLAYGGELKLDEEGRTRTKARTGGYVYLLKSDHGYKIGRSIDVKSRTKLFGIKLPFDIEVLHYGYFEDYIEAERMLHQKYAGKRLNGEWFDLCGRDIEDIKVLGKSAPLSNL